MPNKPPPQDQLPRPPPDPPKPKPTPVEVKPWERQDTYMQPSMGYLPQTLQGWRGYATGGMPGSSPAIVGEGLIPGTKQNKRLEVIAEPEAFQFMRWAEGDTLANLTPGSVIMTIHETPATMKAVKGNIARQSGQKATKTKGGKYRVGGRVA